MRTSPSIVPRDDDQDIYLVMDDFGGRLGRAWRETEPDSTERETLIRDLLDGQYSNPFGLLASTPRSDALFASAAGAIAISPLVSCFAEDADSDFPLLMWPPNRGAVLSCDTSPGANGALLG